MDNVRSESFLGSDKVIVGNKYADLVLETLGKVYIKTGNSSRVLSDVLALLDRATESEIKSQTIIVGSQLEMESMEYPGDGFFVYNTLTTTLYIAYDERYVALIEAAEGADDGYVRRRGDTMTGQLEINTIGAPLIVASSKLVKNLNVEYIDGYSADDLAKKKVDEYIYGNWTFKGKGVSENNWTFKENVRMYGDLVTSGSISTPEFASGFGGYGWRLDADNNMLTIDYLVVRKAMRVYEMVINKISATNGSIWVSNSSKCSAAVQPLILTDKQLSSVGVWTGSEANKAAILRFIKSGTYYVPLPASGVNYDNYRTDGTGGTVTLTSEISKPSSVNTTAKTFVNHKFIIHIKNPEGLVNSPLFKGPSTLYDETLLASEWSTYTGIYDEATYEAFKKCITLYYISKEKIVTRWGGAVGTPEEGTIPVEWSYKATFDKDYAFYMIPKIAAAAKDYESKGYNSSYFTGIKTYYKYFALDRTLVDTAVAQANTQFDAGTISTVKVPNLWVVNTDDDEYPLFKPGDIIRCQKYTDGNIKYYDAVVMSQIGTRQFIVQKATSVFDIYTEIEYNDDGSVKSSKEEYNTTQYNKTESSYNVNTGKEEPKSTTAKEAESANPDTSADKATSRLDDIAANDDMIQVGNIYDTNRQNAIYLTSCDDDGPFIDVISGLNRPDYSVLYDLPIYIRMEYIHTESDNGYRGIKYKYYLQDKNTITEGSIPIYSKDEDGKIKVDDKGNKIILYRGTIYPTRVTLLKQVDGKYKHAYSKTTRVRLGNLDGIYNEVFGKKQPYGFGLYGENVFLTGEFYLNNGQSVVNFSEDNILLKFKSAGLVIRDVNPVVKVPVIGLDGKPVLNEDGTPKMQNKTEIFMNADQFVFTIAGNPAMKLSGLFNNKGQFQEALLDVNGWIQSRGLSIRDTEKSTKTPYTPRPTLGTGIYTDTAGDYVTQEGYYINSFINTKGNLHARNGYFKGEIYATSGYFSGEINAKSGRIGDFVIEQAVDGTGAWIFPEDPYMLYQKYGPINFMTSTYQQGFKFGVGKKTLFDNHGAFLEIYTQYNSLIENIDAIGIKVAGSHIAGIFASAHTGLSYMGVTDTISYPSVDYRVAGFFDGNVYCNSLVHIGHTITTKCSKDYTNGRVLLASGYDPTTGRYNTNGQGERIIDVSNKGTPDYPVPGQVYGGVTFDMKLVDLDKVRFMVVNGLIVGVAWE